MINSRTAKALAIDIPPKLQRAMQKMNERALSCAPTCESMHIVDLAYLRRHVFGQQAAQEQVAARQVLKV